MSNQEKPKLSNYDENATCQNQRTVDRNGSTTKEPFWHLIVLWCKMESYERDIAKHCVKVMILAQAALEGGSTIIQ